MLGCYKIGFSRSEADLVGCEGASKVPLCSKSWQGHISAVTAAAIHMHPGIPTSTRDVLMAPRAGESRRKLRHFAVMVHNRDQGSSEPMRFFMDRKITHGEKKNHTQRSRTWIDCRECARLVVAPKHPPSPNPQPPTRPPALPPHASLPPSSQAQTSSKRTRPRTSLHKPQNNYTVIA